MQYKAIIFDCFGVIVSPVAPCWLKKNLPEADAARLTKEAVDPVDRGEISETELIKQVAEAASKTPEEVRNEWLAMAFVNSVLVDRMKALRGHYKIALCSNATAPFLREIMEKNDLTDIFDEIVISSEVHITKPDPAIFKLVLSHLGTRPEETIFIDDDERNVSEADQLGIKGFVFSDFEQMKNDLESIGVAD